MKGIDFWLILPPSCPPLPASPWPPRGGWNFFGRFLVSSYVPSTFGLKKQFPNIKNERDRFLAHIAPQLPPFTRPPVPPGGDEKFLGGFWHLLGSNPSHLAQKIGQNHQFWSNKCMTPFVAALCSAAWRCRRLPGRCLSSLSSCFCISLTLDHKPAKFLNFPHTHRGRFDDFLCQSGTFWESWQL